MGATATSTKPTFAEALALWGKLGVLSFGGPAGQIALMHRLLVDERRWIGEKSFLHALNFCMLLPGPEAMQLATYVGWRLHGTPGGLAAGLLFVLPGAMVVLALSIAYALYGQVPLVEAAFLGVKAAVPSRRCCASPGAPCAVVTILPSPPRPSPPFSSSPCPFRLSSPPRRCWAGFTR
jgi:chromate transporter